MKNILKPTVLVILTAGLTTSCVNYDDGYYDSAPIQNSVHTSQASKTQKLLNQRIEKLNLQLASLSETSLQNTQRIAYLEQQLGTITAQLDHKGENYEKIMAQLKAERAERESMTKAMKNQFSKELAKTESSLRQRQNEVIKAISTTPSPGSNYNVYTVHSGDTLSVISKAAGVPVKRIKKVNGLTSDIIRVGQKLKIPAK
jgi:LysM repeat protein